jgi:two-component system, NtrC family, sensor kinase
MKLGTKLITALVTLIVFVMAVHGYLSIRQDQQNIEREIRIGMRGSARAIQIALESFFTGNPDTAGLNSFVDTVFPRGNIHGLIVYDLNARPIAYSASLRYREEAPELDPGAILELDPRVVLNEAEPTDGYLRSRKPLVYYRIEPVFNPVGELVGAFVFARHGGSLTVTIQERRNRIILTTAALVALLSLLILLIVRRSITQPINQLIGKIREIASGQWSQRITVPGSDEVALLAKEFNLMSDKLQTAYSRLLEEQRAKLQLERDLRYSERLASMGRLAAGLAHEIGTPLNIIGGRAEFLLRRSRSPEESTNNLQVIRAQADRITGIVRQLLEFSRRKEPTFRTVHLAALLADVQTMLEHQIREKGIGVELIGLTHLPPFQADPAMLQQVFLNLYTNALHVLRHGGSIKICAGIGAVRAAQTSLFNGAHDETNRLWITFEDDGPGISPDYIDRIFDPFFTTKDVGEGSGLGLSVSYGIIKDHDGEIRAESELGEYTRFVIELPIAREASESVDRRVCYERH